MSATDSTALSVGFISLGCAKNLVDSQLMAGTLVTEGIALAASPEDADVVLVNTCSFVQDARDESFDAIEGACELKRRGDCRYVIVAGCLPQRYHDNVLEHHPEVDAIVGLDALEDVAGIVRRVTQDEGKVLAVSETPTRTFEPRVPGLVFTGGPYAYLKIAEGCDHACSFCAIPGIRGRHRSRAIFDIRAEAEKLLESGYRELNIISQDVTVYGRDLPGHVDLPALLRELDGIGGDFWIRLLYGYPSHVSDELLEAMTAGPHVCAYLDIPVQHSHPDILKAMRRGNTVDSVTSLTGRIRDRLPRAAIRTTCLVGFPGESETHFEHLLDYAREAQFDHLGAFSYSPEDGTPSADLENTPTLQDADERRGRLLLAQRDVVDARCRSLVGQETTVLLECPLDEDGLTWRGRSQRYAPEVDGDVIVNRVPPSAQPGDFLRARYRQQRDYDMLAEALESPESDPQTTE